MNDFYVYAFLDIRKRGNYKYDDFEFECEPFYIGKGHGNRAYNHMQKTLSETNNSERNNHKKNKAKKILRETSMEPTVLIYKDGLTEQEALSLEEQMILSIGKSYDKRGPLTNLADGGKINSGIPVSKETRDKISNTLKERYKNGEIDLVNKGSFKQGDIPWNIDMKGKMPQSFYDNCKKPHNISNKGLKAIIESNKKIHTGRKNTEETKRKMSESAKGKTKSKEHIEKIAYAKSKEWTIKDFDGKITTFKNLNKFCRKNDIKINDLKIYGESSGYELLNYNPPKSERRQCGNHSKSWEIIHPNGKIEIIESLLKFCRENNIIYNSLHKGKYKNWRATRYV